MKHLITEHLPIWTTAPNGIKKLRELILELAVRGLLVPQDPNDEPASELLKQIQQEKARLITEGKIKPAKPLAKINESEKPFNLAKGWEWVRFNDCYDVRDGTHDSPKFQLKGYPLITSKNLYSGKLDFTNVNFISEEDHLKIIARSRVDRNDILFAMIGSIGNPVIVDTDIEFSIKNVALFKYFSIELSVPKYLRLYLELASTTMKEKSSGGVQSFISLGALRAYLMPLPPLAEQHRIVAKVDELMRLCDQLEQKQQHSQQTHRQLVTTLLGSLSNAADHNALHSAWAIIAAHFNELFTTEYSIEQLKQTLLQLAVRGLLVPQNPNDQPASELLKQIQQEKARLINEGKIKPAKPLAKINESEKPFNLPNGWESVRFGTIAEIERGGSPRPIKSFLTEDPNGLNWIKIGDTDKGGKYIVSAAEKIIKEGLSKTRMVYAGDFLLTNSMSFGRPYITKIDGCIHDGWLRISPPSTINKDYLYLLLSSPYIVNTFKTSASGAVVQNLNADKVRDVLILIPPFNEQHRIVAKVDELMALCEQLKTKLATTQTLQQHLADTLTQQAVA